MEECTNAPTNLHLHSFSLSEESVHGGSQQAAPPPGGLLHTLVPLLLHPEPPPGLLPAGGLQQHHPVSVWWWELRFDLSDTTRCSHVMKPDWRTPPLSGNCNLMYAIIRKRNVFHHLANLPSDEASIQKALQKKKRSSRVSRANSTESESMEGSTPAVPAEPGTLKTSLEATPGMTLHTRRTLTLYHKSFWIKKPILSCPAGIDKITEKSQVTENGTMVALPDSDSPPAAAENGATAGASDTESNSERDHEVNEDVPSRSLVLSLYEFLPLHWLLCWFSSCGQILAESESTRSRLASESGVANPDWVRTSFIQSPRCSVRNRALWLVVVLRCCRGRRNFLCRPSCGCCRCWFLRWRRSASTSEKLYNFKNQILNTNCSGNITRIMCVYNCDETSDHLICSFDLSRPSVVSQGFDRRVRNPEVPPARDARGPPADPSSHPHQEVPGQRRHGHVVPHVHVGSHLLTVGKRSKILNVLFICRFVSGKSCVLKKLFHSVLFFPLWLCCYSNLDPPIWYDTDIRLFDIQRI